MPVEDPKASRGEGRGRVEPKSEAEASEEFVATGMLGQFLGKSEEDDQSAKDAAAAAAEGDDADRETDDKPKQEDVVDDDEPKDEDAGEDKQPAAEPEYRVVKVGEVEYELPVALAEEYEKGTLRHGDYTRKAQAVAAERKAVEAAKAEIQREKETYVQLLTRLEQAIEDISPSKAPDWNKIRQEDPEGFPERFAEYAIQSQQREAVKKAREEAEAEVQKARAEQHRARMAEEKERLAEVIPEFADPEKGPSLYRKLVKYAKDTYQFDERDIDAIPDHRVLVLLNKARLYDEAKAGIKIPVKIPGQRHDPPRSRPVRIMKPGGAAANAQQGAGRNAMEKAAARLAKTGSDKDAADFLLAGGFLKS